MPNDGKGRKDPLEVYHVHAFSRTIHGGNPAGVCLLDEWPHDSLLRGIAQDLGPSVTAFVLLPRDGSYPLRWFTRGGLEIGNFCGHATISAAHVLLRLKRADEQSLAFQTASGLRHVELTGDYLNMTVPNWSAEECACPEAMLEAIGGHPISCLHGKRDYALIFETEDEVRGLRPDFEALRTVLGGHTAVIATAQRSQTDIVHRFFCPGFSTEEDEDPATGSAMSTLVPYWSERLGLSEFRATQLSARGGFFFCSAENGLIKISSDCVTYLVGTVRR